MKEAQLFLDADVAIGPTAPHSLFIFPQHPDVDQLGAGSLVAGSSSRIVRTNDGVFMMIETSGLPAGDAFTVWWVVFNKPGSCSGPCGEDDIFIDGDPNNDLNLDGVEAAGISILRATGDIVGPDGAGHFAAYLAKDEISEALFGSGLTNPQGAEIHLVLKSHGQMLPDLVEEQIHTIEGGCPPNDCLDYQFAVYQP